MVSDGVGILPHVQTLEEHLQVPEFACGASCQDPQEAPLLAVSRLRN